MDEQNSCCVNKFKEPKFVLFLIGIVLLAAVIIVSIIRDRIVNTTQSQVTVTGQGKITYAPDKANVNLGVQVNKAATAEEALKQLNDKMKKIVTAVKAIGIKDEDIKTESYNLSPQYDYIDGIQKAAGYNASENLVIKVRGVDKNTEITGQVVAAANDAGANDINGIQYAVSDTNSLKQQARVKAIQDAKQKSAELFKAAGVQPKRVVGWYENNLTSPDQANYGYGAAEGMGGAPKAVSVPQVPSGTQDIIIEIGLNYEVK